MAPSSRPCPREESPQVPTSPFPVLHPGHFLFHLLRRSNAQTAPEERRHDGLIPLEHQAMLPRDGAR